MVTSDQNRDCGRLNCECGFVRVEFLHFLFAFRGTNFFFNLFIAYCL